MSFLTHRVFRPSLLLVLLLSLCMCLQSFAQTDEPILCLELGMHTNAVQKISSDAAGKYLLTCSDDKTARLWDRQTGKQLHIYRVPMMKDGIGKLNACAISPDGSIVAVGGATLDANSGSFCIYIFNTQTAEITRRLLNFRDIINEIKFSKKGNLLAVSTVADKSLSVFELPGFQEQKILGEIPRNIISMDFSPKGELAVVGKMGMLALYDDHFVLQKIMKTGSSRPRSLEYNAAGTELAIGYADEVTIEIRNASSLALLKSMRGTGAGIEKDLASVATSGNQGMLWSGGNNAVFRQGEGLKYNLRKWAEGGKGTYVDYPIFKNTIYDLETLHDGSVAVATFQPEIALVRQNGEVAWMDSSVTNNYGSRDASHFRINENGDQIAFTAFGEPPLWFSVDKRDLSDHGPIISPPLASSAGLAFSNWRESPFPEINGRKTAFFGTNEACTSVGVSIDGSFAVLGSNFNLYGVDKNGTLLWKNPLPADASAVNISGNQKLVIAALNDGTIRWYRASDGKELLAFFLHRDRKRWVLYTPSGFYDASPGADEFLGWHINNGTENTPTFYPVERFKSLYYKPALIDALFSIYDEVKAIGLVQHSNQKPIEQNPDLRKKLPPTVIIHSPFNGFMNASQEISVDYQVNVQVGSSLKSLKILIDGRPVDTDRGTVPVAGTRRLVRLRVPPKDCVVSLLAANEYGYGPEAKIAIQWDASAGITQPIINRPTLYALVIGVSNYDDPDLRLRYAAKDAADFANCIRKQKGGLYKDVVIRSLSDKVATRANIIRGFSDITRQTSQNDVAMIYFAGHGINDAEDNFFMIPSDGDKKELRVTCIDGAELRRTVSEIPGKVLVFLDACHSGNVMGNGMRGLPDLNALANDLASAQNGAIIFTGSTGRGKAMENDTWQNGIFTKAVVAGLAGKAVVPESAKITVGSLNVYIYNSVYNATNGNQKPSIIVPSSIQDFPIALLPLN